MLKYGFRKALKKRKEKKSMTMLKISYREPFEMIDTHVFYKIQIIWFLLKLSRKKRKERKKNMILLKLRISIIAPFDAIPAPSFRTVSKIVITVLHWSVK